MVSYVYYFVSESVYSQSVIGGPGSTTTGHLHSLLKFPVPLGRLVPLTPGPRSPLTSFLSLEVNFHSM